MDDKDVLSLAFPRHYFVYVQFLHATWVTGSEISAGIRGEILAAVRLGIPVVSMGIEQARIQAVIAEMKPMLDEKNCLMGSNRADYAGKLLVLDESVLAPWARDPQNQLWIANGGGFGTSPTARGQAVYATNLMDGEVARFNRSDFLGIADR